MRRFLVAVVTLLVIAAAVAPAFADTGGQPNEAANGQCVSGHAQGGELGSDMNPGMHQGNSGDHHGEGCP